MSEAQRFDPCELDEEALDGVVVYSRSHIARDSSLARRVRRIRSIVFMKTRAILWLWFVIPLAVSCMLPSMLVPLGWRGMIVYCAWVLFAMAFYHFVIKPSLQVTYHPRSEDHKEGFPVGFQPDFWQWKWYQESRDDLREISGRLGLIPCPTMAMKSIAPSGFGMVFGSESPHVAACVIFPTKPSNTQTGFSREAHRGVLVHECGHIVLSTRLWCQKFEMLDLVLSIPLTILFTFLLGQIAAYQGMSQQEWQSVGGWLFTLQVPYIMAVMFGKLGERIISRIHEFGCDAITAVYGEGEGLIEAFHGFAQFTKDRVAALPLGEQLGWYLFKVPYREIWGTHPNLARRIRNCRAYMR